MPEFKPQTFQGSKKQDVDLPEQTTQQTEANNRRRQTFKKSLIDAGFDLSSRDQIKEIGRIIISDVNRIFGEKYGLSVSEENLPLIHIGTKPCFRSFRNEEGRRINVIELSGIDDVLDRDTIAEELNHFYRYYFEPEETNEEITGEFFGFLGSMLLRKINPELSSNNLEVLVDDKKREFVPKKEVLNFSKETRDTLRLGANEWIYT